MAAEPSTDPAARDLVGWGRRLPEIRWPGNARVAVSVVLNYEEGSEYSVADGDAYGEQTAELPSRMPATERDLAVETTFDYGSRAGVWRLQRLIDAARIPITVFGTAVAFQRNPEVVDWLRASGHEPCPHGLRWEDPWTLSETAERAHIHEATTVMSEMFGHPPTGWYCRYGPSSRTRRLLLEHGGYRYDSDSYADDVPYFIGPVSPDPATPAPHVVVPYSLATNDIRFVAGVGPHRPQDFFELLRDTLDYLRGEPDGAARMMSVGLHCRIAGQPGRARAVRDFIDYALQQDGVWFARRDTIAAHWLTEYRSSISRSPAQPKETSC